jgi:chloramphenicol 3-O phosphotransferase
VIADHVLIDTRWLQDCAQVLAPHRADLVGVRCPLDVVEQRERDR